MPPVTANNRRCPSCGKPIASGSACTSCGFDPSAGVVRRDKPEQTRGLDAVALRFGPKWCFGGAALLVLASFIYFDDITTAEERGGSFSADPFTILIYEAAGKWAVTGFWVVCAGVAVAAGFRALSLRRAAGSE
ncbi:MAG TPA: hypothetical protein VM096_07505 [Vicinamibacterales bacterium]|nr:hypothetical protein [Vicinamibacterales bacterium]